MKSTNIYDAAFVISDDAVSFRVVVPYVVGQSVEQSKVKFRTIAEADNVTMALALQKAYCVGYYDGSYDDVDDCDEEKK